MSSTPIPPESADDRDRTPDAERLLHKDIQYESPDIGIYRILAVLVGIVFVFVGAGLVCYFVLKLDRSSEDRAGLPSQYDAPNDSLPAEPRLEPLDRNT